MSNAPKTQPWYKTGKGLSAAGIGLVFAFAVYMNAIHAVHVALHYGQPSEVAYPTPAVLDIFAFFCAIRLRSATTKIQRILNRIGMWSMLTMSLWFNIEFALLVSKGHSGSYLAKSLLISGFVSGVVSLAAEILTHVRKSTAGSSTKPKPVAEPKAASKAPTTSTKAPTAPKATSPRQRKAPAAETLSTAPVAN